jgi:hypothetical protein
LRAAFFCFLGTQGLRKWSPRSDRVGETSRPVSYSDEWYYIGKNDLPTKRFFKLLGTLWSIAISKSSAATEGAPVLTVPVAR